MIRVGVLRGGPSGEHEISLKTAEGVLSSLSDKYISHDIFLSKDGDWFFDKKPSHPEKIFRSVDVVFNALHGEFGEDGKVQRLLETFNIPYTGSGVMASAIGMNKVLSRGSYVGANLLIPRGVVVNSGDSHVDSARKAFSSIGNGWVVKPASAGSSLGVSIAKSFDKLVDSIAEASKFDSKILVEEYIPGREFTCGVLENFRGKEHYSLPVVEIIPPKESEFFSADVKYTGETIEVCPANIDLDIKRKIEEIAVNAHRALGCAHYSRSDFIVSPKGKIYLLETNTLPGLTSESLFPKSIEAVGLSYSGLLDHLIGLALKKRR